MSDSLILSFPANELFPCLKNLHTNKIKTETKTMNCVISNRMKTLVIIFYGRNVILIVQEFIIQFNLSLHRVQRYHAGTGALPRHGVLHLVQGDGHLQGGGKDQVHGPHGQ